MEDKEKVSHIVVEHTKKDNLKSVKIICLTVTFIVIFIAVLAAVVLTRKYWLLLLLLLLLIPAVMMVD